MLGALNFDWIEGSRSFDVAFGAVTSATCLLVAVPILWWGVAKKKVWLFSPEIDPHQRLQLAYGVFVMAMAFTDALCRFIPHGPLSWVHPAFFITTLIIAAGLGPRVAYLILREFRSRKTVPKTAALRSS
jgi:hypothetical protein